MIDFFDVLYERRSVRSYTDQPLPDDCVEELLRAAACAPSAHNAQPWHFIVCKSQQAKERLLRETAAPFRRMLASTGLAESKIEERVSDSYAYFTNIPILILVFMTAPEREGPHGTERTLALQSVSAAIAQLLLAAQAKGLGACWYSLPLHCPDAVSRALEGKPGWEPVALVTLGYEAAQAPRKAKRPLNELYTVL